MSASAPGSRAALLGCAFAVAAAAVPRVMSAFGDFWLDEIWTYYSVQRLESALEVFTGIHHSNNNHLNSLLFYGLGDREAWWIYRVPHVLAGIGTVVLAARLAWRWGRAEAVFASVLVGSCFALIHFSSEARGYSLAVFFALGAWLALESDLSRHRAGTALVFGVCSTLGLLSHLVFLFFSAGALAQSGWRLLRPGQPAAAGLRRMLWLHALPIAAFGALYAVDLRQLEVGGGNPTDFAWLFARTFGFSLGLPAIPGLAWVYASGAGALLLLGLAMLRRRGDDTWILLGIAIAVAPAAVIGAMRPDVVAVRYFLVGIACFLVLTSVPLAHLYRASVAGRAASLALLALFVLGNTVHTAAFLASGRGGFHAALRAMARDTEGRRIVVGSDHDFRNGMVLRFYGRQLPKDKSLVYLRQRQWPAGGPDWFVTHRAERPQQVPPRVRDAQGNSYVLAGEFDHAAISGFFWAVYRNETSVTRPSAGEAPSRTPDP